MAVYTVDIQQAFIEAFGVAGLRRFPDANKAPGTSPDVSFSGIQLLNIDEADATSMLGTPIYMPFTIQAGSYKQRIDGEVRDISYPEFRFPGTTLIDFNRTKKIVKTEIAGRDGEVKEMISLRDWEINIRCLLVSNITSPDFENKYPAQQLQEARRLYENRSSVRVLGKLFAWLGIVDMVIEDFGVPALEGYSNMQPFTMRCSSDTPIELQFKNR